MRVIGTAGHVDHGKSALVEALTGIHPDRLKEEQEREMTIDLGFAWLSLPDGEEVGIIDVPGHRDFIENMLAGIGGIDAALFVVAADEGVMPQTREHLAILDILQVQGGIVALTKIDLIPDRDWLDLVEEDLRQVLAGTVLAESPVARVSAKTGEGLEALLETLTASLADRPPRADLGRPRLPVDRVFTISGFGTVVTGTLNDGHLRVGEEVEILPRGLRGRVRGLQTHKRKEEQSVPGSRTAVNISGVDLDSVARGDVVAHPGDFEPTRRLDVGFRLLPDASQAIKHNTEVKLFIGSAEVVARLRLLGVEALQPGEEGWLQLELRHPVVAVRGDRYILRRPSPGETLGGGLVVDPQPRGRHKRFDQDILGRLEALTEGAPGEVLMQATLVLGAAPVKEVVGQANLEAEIAAQALKEMLAEGQLLLLDGDDDSPQSGALMTSRAYWDSLSSRAAQEVTGYHQANPLRRGIPREELKSRLKLEARLFNALMSKLAAEGVLVEAGPLVALPDHAITFSPEEQRAVDGLLARFDREPHAPPSIKDCQAAVGGEVFAALVDLGELVTVSPEVAFRSGDYEKMVASVREMLAGGGSLTVAQARDHFNTSRRYVLAFLEHLDAIGVTVREGDARRLRS